MLVFCLFHIGFITGFYDKKRGILDNKEKFPYKISKLLIFTIFEA